MLLLNAGRGLMFVVFVTSATEATAAAGPARITAEARRVRTFEPHLRDLLEEGLRISATLRALVDRLEQSDLVVYVMSDPRPVRRVDGRLTLMAAVSGARYVMVRIRELPHPGLVLAIVGHELQHAMEIADDPAIVDAESMAQAYSRMGYATQAMPSGLSFDTRAAVEAGMQVWRELQAARAEGADE
ncbi:MAG: hypothetical protein HYU37_18060 [Acidobacteria bacterium]|nr:hypothetical protein [Acidobacteriota bacterium]